MRKKILITLLCMLTSLGVLSGCGSSKETDITVDNVQEDNAENDNQGVSSGGEVTIDEEVVAEEADKLYTVTANGIVNDELSDFFLLWFGCKLDGEPEIKNLSSMLEHSGIIGMLTINEGLHTVHNYDDTYFTGLDIYYHLPERPHSYYVTVSNRLSNFDTFRIRILLCTK